MANGGARGRWGVHKRVLLWTGFEPARLSPAELKSASLDHSDTIALDGVEPGTTLAAPMASFHRSKNAGGVQQTRGAGVKDQFIGKNLKKVIF